MDNTSYLLLSDGTRVAKEYALRCYCAIEQIKEILKDDRLDDKECFWRIEEIVVVFEELGFDAGARHDF